MVLLDYSFCAQIWKSEGPGGWYFVSVPQAISKNVRAKHFDSEEGWGRVKAQICAQNVVWNTSIWFDTKLNCYLIPIKAAVRKKLGIAEGASVHLSFSMVD